MNFKKGQLVNILAFTLNGRLVHEGVAEVIKPPPTVHDNAKVKFLDNPETYERWIDPSAQVDDDQLVKYIAAMNRLYREVQS